MTNSEKLRQAIAFIESQRSRIDEQTAEAALAGLRAIVAGLPTTEERTDRSERSAHMVGERKLVTVMFADISGFTALSEQMDPEAVRDLLNDCFDHLTPVVERYSGTVDKYVGDEIMALFGAPVTHENDAELALRASLEMMNTLAAFNGKRKLDLGLHFGINTGRVIAGGIGAGRRQEYSVVGDTVNVAARLEDMSERGQILVGPDTFRLARHLFDFEGLGSVQVKGRAQYLSVYRLLGERRKSVGAEKPGRAISIVGRETERSLLADSLNRVLQGNGGIVSVIGEPGLGKTRLLAELRHRDDLQKGPSSVMWLEGNTLCFGHGIGYRPFREILTQCAHISEDDNDDEAWSKLEACILQLFDDRTPEILPYLAVLLGLTARDTHRDRVQYLDAEGIRRRIFLASRSFFETLARVAPLVLVFEDLQWMDESSVLLLEHLFPLVERVPLLIFGISRPDDSAPANRLRNAAAAGYPHSYSEIRLAPLSEASSGRLVKNLQGTEHMSPAMRDAIVRKSEGNPFFIEEIVQSLKEAGKISRDPATGRMETLERPDLAVIPDTIQGVMMARVDRLQENVRRVLLTASVIGHSFHHKVLFEVSDAGPFLDEYLDELQSADFIIEKQSGLDREFAFKNELIRETAYESILLQQRRELHERTAQCTERLFQDRKDEFFSLLAYHYSQAEAWDKAQEYLVKGGDTAGRVAADSEALEQYRRALDAYSHTLGDRWEPLQRASLERKMGEALFRKGDREEALQYLQRALKYLGKPLPVSSAATRSAIAVEAIRQFGRRILPKAVNSDREHELSPVAQESLRIYEVIGWIDAFGNYERFLLIALINLNDSERFGYPYGCVTGSMALGTISDLLALFRLAAGYHRRALESAVRAEHPAGIALAHVGLSLHHICLGNWSAVARHANNATEMSDTTGDLHLYGYALYMLAVGLAYTGRSEEALRRCNEIIRIGQDGGDPQVHCWGLAVKGFVQRRTGHVDEAAETLGKARELAQATLDYAVSVWSGTELARCGQFMGRLDEALEEIAATREYHDSHPKVSLIWVPMLNAIAAVHLAQWERCPRKQWAERKRAATRSCRQALKHAKIFRILLPEALRLQGTHEWIRGKPAKARRWWNRSLQVGRSLGQRWDEATTYREMSLRLNDTESEQRARNLFNEMGKGKS